MAESLKGSFGFTIGERKQYSSTDIDYKSVKQQSGIFAGDQGFDVTVKGNTNLIGAVIAGSQKSINDGVNQLTTGTLTTSDLKNKAKYDASSTGMSGGYNGTFDVGSRNNVNNNGSKIDPNTGNLSPNGMGAANSWNNVSVSRPSVLGAHDSSNSTTYSGVSGGKITITDSFGQSMITGKTAEQAINELNRGVATGVDQSNTLEKIYDEASIKASFNITKQLNTEVGIFQANRAAERAQSEAVIKELDKKGSFENLSPAEQAAYRAAQNALKDSEMWAMGGKGTLVLNAISLAANGNVTGSGADLIRDSAVNYLQGLTAQQIKSIADELQSESARAALHAISACAGASVVLNSALDKLLATNADDMTSAEKDARVNLITSIIAGITQAAGGDAAMANACSRIEMENNLFGFKTRKEQEKEHEEKKVQNLALLKLLDDPEIYSTLTQAERDAMTICEVMGGDPRKCQGVPGANLDPNEYVAFKGKIKIGAKFVVDSADPAWSIVDPTDPLNYVGGAVFAGTSKIGGKLYNLYTTSKGARVAVNAAEDIVETVGKGVVQSRINVRIGDGSTGSGLEYAWKKHGGSWGPNKSAFNISQSELKTLLQSKSVVSSTPYYSATTGNYIRVVDVGKSIGVDAKNGGATTSFITVITDKQGNLVNTFPGKIKVD